jgi:dTDP-4-dehydrorhamnose 3,5-epimerase-like enzyme
MKDRGSAANLCDLEVDDLARFVDARGTLVPLELSLHIPFKPVSRFFFISDVPPGVARGAHAHRSCEQYLLCLSGSVSVKTSDGEQHREVRLSCGQGLHIPPLIFSSELFSDPEAVLGVFCSEPYDASDYIVELSDLVELRRIRNRQD